jgi:hypothetical protein
MAHKCKVCSLPCDCGQPTDRCKGCKACHEQDQISDGDGDDD